MEPVLAENSYGKSQVRLAKVVRRPDRHDFVDLTVDVALEGRYRAVHLEGDNSPVLPTDTMKNTVYVMARQHSVEPLEAFAQTLVEHFLGATGHADRCHVRVAANTWQRMTVGGRPHHHAFVRGSAERRIARVSGERGALRFEAGIDGLEVLKTTGSSFEGYLKDAYTTLPEAADRIFATIVTAWWRYTVSPADPDDCFARVRTALMETFASHDESRSVQHTLYFMGAAALDACPEMEEIRLSLPNRHNLLANLAPFGLDNPNEVFVPTLEPYGLIEATVRRGEAG